jgi:hypothetical protein
MALMLNPFLSPYLTPPVSPYSKVTVGPYSTTVTSPYASPYASPYINPYFANSPVSKVTVGPYSTTVTTTNLITKPLYEFEYEYDTGLNDNPFAQKEMVEHMHYLVLDKWLYKDMCHVLKYLKISNEKVSYINSVDDFKDNKICNDSENDVKLKADFIENNILDRSQMRKLLKRIIDELGYKWYELPLKESIIIDTVERYLKKELKKKITNGKTVDIN